MKYWMENEKKIDNFYALEIILIENVFFKSA